MEVILFSKLEATVQLTNICAIPYLVSAYNIHHLKGYMDLSAAVGSAVPKFKIYSIKLKQRSFKDTLEFEQVSKALFFKIACTF